MRNRITILGCMAVGLLFATPAFSDDAMSSAQRAQMPFAERPVWQRRVAIVAHDGLPMIRLRHGTQSDLVVGINRKGFLGIYTTLPDHLLLR
jgi:hypothetical protein